MSVLRHEGVALLGTLFLIGTSADSGGHYPPEIENRDATRSLFFFHALLLNSCAARSGEPAEPGIMRNDVS